MKIAFDSNVLLDAIANREHGAEAQELVLAVASDQALGLVTANSITDIYYIARKHLGDAAAREAVRNILTVFDIATVGGEDCSAALEVPMKDFEDALLAVCAKRDGANYIATRDEAFISSNAPVPAMKPERLLRLLKSH